MFSVIGLRCTAGGAFGGRVSGLVVIDNSLSVAVFIEVIDLGPDVFDGKFGTYGASRAMGRSNIWLS